jgi:hypothetical protein
VGDVPGGVRPSMRSVVRLGDLVGFVDCLDVRCTRCGRDGRLRLARLLAVAGCPDRCRADAASTGREGHPW